MHSTNPNYRCHLLTHLPRLLREPGVGERLRFVMPILAVDRVLAADDHAIIPPGLPHHVEPLGPMRMRVVFLRVPAGR